MKVLNFCAEDFGVGMGQVALTFNINLSSPQVNAEGVKKSLEKINGFANAEIRPLAFGMKQITVIFTFNDRAGADTDALEKEISKIKGVASVDVGDVSLI